MRGVGHLRDDQQRPVEAFAEALAPAARRRDRSSGWSGRWMRRSSPAAAPSPAPRSASIVSAAKIAIAHGRRCTNALQRIQAPPAAGGRADAPEPRRRRRRSPACARSARRPTRTRPPANVSSAGSSVSDASITSSTPIDADRRHAVEEVDTEQHHPEQRDHDGGAGEQDGAPGGVHRLDDRLARVPERRARASSTPP